MTAGETVLVSGADVGVGVGQSGIKANSNILILEYL